MTYSQKYCIVSFLKPLAEGVQFSMDEWPLHITLADVFAIELTDQLISDLSSLSSQQSPIKTLTESKAILGTTQVILLTKNDDLKLWHNSLVYLLERHGAKFNTPEYTRTGFLPHCTIQKEGALQLHEEVSLSSLSLVDMLPNGDWRQRKIIKNFSLNS